MAVFLLVKPKNIVTYLQPAQDLLYTYTSPFQFVCAEFPSIYVVFDFQRKEKKGLAQFLQCVMVHFREMQQRERSLIKAYFLRGFRYSDTLLCSKGQFWDVYEQTNSQVMSEWIWTAV